MLIRYLVSGLISGSLYGLIGLAFGLVYISTGVFDLALGAVFALSAYSVYFFISTAGWAEGAAVVFGALVAVGAGLLLELSIYRPLARRKAGWNVLFVASMGVYIFLTNLLAACFGSQANVLRPGPSPTCSIGFVSMSRIEILKVGTLLLALTAVYALLTRTRRGLEVRALADNPQLASALGVNTLKTRTLIFCISYSVAAVAGILSAYDIGVQPNCGLEPVLGGAVGVMLAGRRWMLGGAIGGVVLGLVQSLAVMFWSARWQQVITFVVLALVLLVRRGGLLTGERRAEET